MKEEVFEGLLKEVLSIEHEMPRGLKVTRSVNEIKEELLYAKIIFFLSCGLIFFEQIVLARMFFVNLRIFFISATLMTIIFSVVSLILYLLKEEINEFIKKMLEVKKYESYN